MSSPEAERSETEALARLEAAVGRAAQKVADLEKQLAEADSEREEFRSALDRFRRDGVDPVEVSRRAELVDRQNQELRERLLTSRDAVEKMLARVRFLEENP